MTLHDLFSTWTTRSAGRPQRRTRRRSSSRRTSSAQLAIERLEERTVLSLSFGWAFSAGSTTWDTGTAIAADAYGYAYVSGSFEGTVDFDPGPGTVNRTNGNSGWDGFVAKYSPMGELSWVTQFEQRSEHIALSGSNVYVAIPKGYGASADHSGQVVKLDAATGSGSTFHYLK